MRFIIGSGEGRTVITRPANKDARRELALTIKRAFFPGKSYRTHKERGAAALSLAVA
jgi:hypothetical protein